MSPSKILFYLCISFIAGIFLESITKIPPIFVWGFLLIGVLMICLSLMIALRGPSSAEFGRGRASILLLGFCFLFLVLGILRTQISEFNITSDKLSKLNNKGEVSLIGIISSEPDVRDIYQKLKVHPVKSAESGASPEAKQFNWVNIDGSALLVTTSKYPEYKYLDKIKVTGKLERPGETEDFSYKKYLMKDGIYSVMNFPEVELLSKEHKYNVFSFLYEKILFFKQGLRESIRHNFLPPQSFILEGTILGDNGAMSNDLKSKLNITGLRHVIAVSGTHVVILGSIIMSLLLAMGFWRGQAFYIAIIFICLYIALTGLPSSGVRAGIMGGLYLLAQKLGRQSMGLRVLAMACAVMLLINPLLLLYDVGFQLSFLAVMGLIYLEPFLKKIMKISIISTTFAAQIFTLPIMVYNFGNISFVSPITNLLVLPVVYWLMVFGFLSSLLGAVSQFLGWIFFVPCWFLLTYFIKIIDFFSQPWAIKTIKNVHWIWLFISYLLIGFSVRFLNSSRLNNSASRN